MRLSCKRVGEIAELAFIARAAERGLITMKPHGDSTAYDVVVDNGRRLWRIQVKSISCCNHGVYQVHAYHGRDRRPYTRGDVDFLAAHVSPEQAWYIVPIAVFAGRGGFCISRRAAKYREAWHLLGGRRISPGASRASRRR